MQTRLVTFLLVLGLALPGLVNAQIGGYVKKKATQAVGRAGTKADEEVTDEMNKKVDKEVTKVFDKLFPEDEAEKPATENTGNTSGTSNSSSSSSGSSTSKSSSDAKSKAMLRAMGISTAPANVKSSYPFEGNIRMTMQSWEKDGSSDGEILYTSYTRKDMKGFAIEFLKAGEGTTHMIFDYEGGSMIIMSDNGSEKSGMVTPIGTYNDSTDYSAQASAEPEEEVDYTLTHPNLRKTGNTKTIAGYKCDEYVYEDEYNLNSYWITRELPSRMWQDMYAANIFAAGSLGYFGGFTMMMEGINKETEEKTLMVVKEVNPNQPKSISTAGYQLMSFGAVQ
jgi:hypothetical protein